MYFTVEKPKFKNQIYNILDFGASTSLRFNNKEAIQKAINTCSTEGGGVVLIPNGYFITGPIELKDNVNLHLEENAFLQFTKSKEEYPLIWTNYEGQKEYEPYLQSLRAIEKI